LIISIYAEFRHAFAAYALRDDDAFDAASASMPPFRRYLRYAAAACIFMPPLPCHAAGCRR